MTLKTQDLEEIVPQWRARLEDALSASTRAKRKLVIVTSTISLVILLLDLFPTKIEALGVAFESRNRNDILLFLAATNIYALVGFFIYAWADLHVRNRVQRNSMKGYVNEYGRGKATFLETVNYRLRIIFDFVVPVIYGVYALRSIFREL
jgi:hypothetical protein